MVRRRLTSETGVGRVYEVDFLPVEAKEGPSSKSGDAITLRFTREADGSQIVVVIDAGFSEVGTKVVEHVDRYYETGRVDLLVSTHPDGDHLNGLKTVLEELEVGELLIHRPQLHAVSVANFTNLEAVNDLIEAATVRGVPVTEPFRGLSRFDDQFLILGPTTSLYERKLREHLAEQSGGTAAAMATARKALLATRSVTTALLRRALASYPEETLGEDGITSARNETSVIALVQNHERRLLLTGDAGLEGLAEAAAFYEVVVGAFAQFPIDLLHVPHHGSRRNLSPSLLDRLLGPTETPTGDTAAVISSAAADLKHPSPKVVNALGRRGAAVVATEGKTICVPWEAPERFGWGPVPPLGALVEDDDG